MNEVKLKALAKELMAKHGLTEQGWRFRTYCNTDKYLGQCQYGPKVIRLNKLSAFINSDEYVVDTILHEIAHALVGIGHGHGDVWKAKAVELGAIPRHCVADDYVMPPRRETPSQRTRRELNDRFINRSIREVKVRVIKKGG